ncbi:MAG: hypothetical protein AAF151_18385 [Cyanobacteria bacterium J06656_5]
MGQQTAPVGKENLSVAVLALANVLQLWGLAMQIMCLSVGMSTMGQRMFTRIGHVQIHGQFPMGDLCWISGPLFGCDY